MASALAVAASICPALVTASARNPGGRPAGPAAAVATAKTSTLVVEPAIEPALSDDFNPFDSGSPLGAMGAPSFVYEPLLEYNELQVDQYYPWLAQSWSFSTSGKTLIFSLRKGVKWADGSAFTASDVAYTFNLLKQNPALDNGLPIVSAVATDALTFTLTLSQPGYSYLYDIALVPIVKAGFARGQNPATYVDKQPDGTGPYELARRQDATRSQVVLTARKGYWQSGAPSISRLVFPAYHDATAVKAALAQGKLDWAGNFMPDVSAAFEQKDRSANHFWAPAVDCVALQSNMGRFPLDQMVVRKAVSLSLGRQSLSSSLTGGYDPPATTSSGLVAPLDDQYLPRATEDDLRANPSTSQAGSLMSTAGFVKDADGFWSTGSGQVLGFSIDAASGSLNASVAQMVARQLRLAGFDTRAVLLAPKQFAAALGSGRFDSAVVTGAAGPSPYYSYQAWLSSPAAAPVGGGAAQLAGAAAAALARYRDSPSDSTAAQAALRKVAAYVSTQLPVIPLIYGAAWAEFSTRHASGWPDGSNPYEPATPAAPFDEYTVLQLTASNS